MSATLRQRAEPSNGAPRGAVLQRVDGATIPHASGPLPMSDATSSDARLLDRSCCGDVEAGHNAGCKSILLSEDKLAQATSDSREAVRQPDKIFPTLLAAAHWIVNQ